MDQATLHQKSLWKSGWACCGCDIKRDADEPEGSPAKPSMESLLWYFLIYLHLLLLFKNPQEHASSLNLIDFPAPWQQHIDKNKLPQRQYFLFGKFIAFAAVEDHIKSPEADRLSHRELTKTSQGEQRSPKFQFCIYKIRIKGTWGFTQGNLEGIYIAHHSRKITKINASYYLLSGKPKAKITNVSHAFSALSKTKQWDSEPDPLLRCSLSRECR